MRLHSGDSLGTGAVCARVRGGSCAPNAMPPFRASLETASIPPPADSFSCVKIYHLVCVFSFSPINS